jgi:glycosyltransferase involved in cell wall biosynthesis
MTVDAVGGVWRYSLDLAQALGTRGVATILAVLGPAPSAAQRTEAEAIAGVTLVSTGEALDWLTDDAASVQRAATAIGALADAHGAQLLHVNQPALAAALPGAQPVVAVAHGCVATWWDAARPGVPLDPKFAWHRTLAAQGLRRADRIVAPSAAYARAVARLYGLRDAPLVVHNGGLPAPASTTPTRDIAFTAGRLWDEVKRTPLLDAAAARLAIPFIAAGATRAPHGQSVAVEHLHPLGELDQPALAAILAARPVFVSAASFEPFGLAVLEAAQAGCALVLSDIATFRELWDGAAHFVSGDDPADYADAVTTLIGDPARRQSLGAAANERAARYTIDAMADAMLAIYADASSGQRVAA